MKISFRWLLANLDKNSRLAVQLTGWGLDIITEPQYQERAKQDLVQQLLHKIPGVSELIALSLTTSGFDSIRSVAEATLELLRTVPGLEEEEAAELSALPRRISLLNTVLM